LDLLGKEEGIGDSELIKEIKEDLNRSIETKKLLELNLEV
jgi:hypothetical protein